MRQDISEALILIEQITPKVTTMTAQKEALVTLLKSQPCADCGNTYPSECMDFDHVTGEKVNHVGLMQRNGTLQSMIDEIEKCELVCANCHRTRTRNRAMGFI